MPKATTVSATATIRIVGFDAKADAERVARSLGEALSSTLLEAFRVANDRAAARAAASIAGASARIVGN